MTSQAAKNIIITSGDRDGIGFEITCKAISTLGPQRRARFLIAAHASSRRSAQTVKLLKKLRQKFQVTEISEVPLRDACSVFKDLRSIEIAIYWDKNSSLDAEATWVQSAALLAKDGIVSGIVTGPVSKERFEALGSGHRGHTSLLAQIGGRAVYQGYIGSKMNVVLATDHVALKDVETALTSDRLKGALNAAEQLRRLLAKQKARLPIRWLGLNPHAGENGLIGTFERRLIAKKVFPPSFGPPLPADSAFSHENLKSIAVYLALYHDQGLIPFKMLHGQDSGFQISLGLPFIRTSVDHGTAKDLYGKGLANPGSMIDAIKAAMVARVNIRSKQPK